MTRDQVRVGVRILWEDRRGDVWPGSVSARVPGCPDICRVLLDSAPGLARDDLLVLIEDLRREVRQ